MPYTYQQSKDEIARLVEQFQRHEAVLQDVPEAQIENDYIRPFFRYLNWNVDNLGLSPAQQEFVLQRTDRRGKRPDYRLQLNGQHLLFMDAKKVKYSMRDPRWVNQVYAYAYSTQNNPPSRKVDFAVLTDFQEFITLDCTFYAARPEAVNNFRVFDWRYADYVAQFDTLWEVFERNNMLEASRERASGLWAHALSPKKVKANRTPPDKAFLAELDDEKTGWRVRLAKDMKRLDPHLDGELITAAVQLLIDRLIFVKVLSDREIEDDYLAQLAERIERAGLSEQDGSWFNACRDIFARLNDFYDGSIFEPRPELEAVQVSNKVVREVIRDLQPEYSPYNFAVLPVEILGTIYERFLGRVVTATAQRVKIEDKPAVRKAGGVFYTPQYIVHYIVQHTVDQLLADCRMPADVAQLKILDPACGSGSFLLGAYDALIEWHKRYYGDKEQLSRKDRDAAYYDADPVSASLRDASGRSPATQDDGRIRLTARLKRQILLNNIYGVDIDEQAVEVTRLSLSLKALEDTRHDELAEERTLFHQTVLPDLSRNIQCGNSLIGPDYFVNQLMPDVEELKRVKPFDWERAFPYVFNRRDVEAIHELPLRDGFDCIIGNPPYIRIQTMKEWAPLEVEIYKELYQAARSGNYDIYVVFVERALRLLNQRGRLGFILPHKFFNAQYGEPLRELLSQGRHLSDVVHFGDEQVFEGATTYTCLLFLSKEPREQAHIVKVDDLDAWRTSGQATEGTLPADRITAADWHFSVGKGAALFEKLSQMPVKLEDVAERIFQGLVTGADPVFILIDLGKGQYLSEATQQEHKLEIELMHPLCKGSVNIRRYHINELSKSILFPYKLVEGKAELLSVKELTDKYPHAWEYLRKNRLTLESRERGKWKHARWYAFGRSQNLSEMEQTKLLTPSIANQTSFMLDSNEFYYFVGSGGGGGGGYGITLKHNEPIAYEYLLGLLNSRLLDAFLKSFSSPFSGGYYAYNRQYIEQLPIRTINFSDPADHARHDRMVALVTHMLDLYKQLAAAKTKASQELYQRQIDAADRQIDNLVYELYGLTEEEIAIVKS